MYAPGPSSKVSATHFARRQSTGLALAATFTTFTTLTAEAGKPATRDAAAVPAERPDVMVPDAGTADAGDAVPGSTFLSVVQAVVSSVVSRVVSRAVKVSAPAVPP
ncbi:hypothetical protein GCM10020001_075340 [Nonomuraea salmonea]